eukprot:6485009-Amphidinium_carterae.1
MKIVAFSDTKKDQGILIVQSLYFDLATAPGFIRPLFSLSIPIVSFVVVGLQEVLPLSSLSSVDKVDQD